MEEITQHKKRQKRAYSPSEILKMKIPYMNFTGEWAEAFGQPAPTGLWIIWGKSGNGKSAFTMKLAKYLCQFGSVFYDSLEEDIRFSFQKNIARNRMDEVDGKFKTLKLSIEDLDARMSDKRKEDIYIIDSFQAAKLSTKQYTDLAEKHPDKLIIFVSRADGNLPKGRGAENLMWDADVKIWVEGFRAICKGRFQPEPGKHFTIWQEGASKYWGGTTPDNDTIE